MKGKKYDYKEAYNTKLKPSARLHYLENARHDTDSPFNQGLIPLEENKKMKPQNQPQEIEQRGGGALPGIQDNRYNPDGSAKPPPTDAELFPERRGNQGVILQPKFDKYSPVKQVKQVLREIHEKPKMNHESFKIKEEKPVDDVLARNRAMVKYKHEVLNKRKADLPEIKKLDKPFNPPRPEILTPLNQVGVVDPLTGLPVQKMTNVPPQQANTMGQAQPVFSPQTQQVAQGMFGSTQSMQNSVGATPLFQVQKLPAVDLGIVKSDYKDKAFGLPFPGDKMYKGTDGFGKYGGQYTKEMTDANSNYTYQHNLANKPDYAEMKQNQLRDEASVVKTEDEGMSNMLQRQEDERRGIMEQTELSDRTELSED